MKSGLVGAVAIGFSIVAPQVTFAEAVPEIDESGNYVFDLASDDSYPGNIKGAGITVTKKGVGTLTLTGASDFTGTIRVEKGKLVDKDSAMSGMPAVVVADKATFESAARGATWNYQLYSSVTVTGSGVDGSGAFIRSGGNACRSGASPLVLDGDATVSLKMNHAIGSVTLNGYVLTVTGGGTWDANGGITPKNIDSDDRHGKIVLTGGTVLQTQNGTIGGGSAENVFELAGGTYYSYAGGKDSAWSVRASADSSIYQYQAHAQTFGGPLSIANGATLTFGPTAGALTFPSGLTLENGGKISAKGGEIVIGGNADLGMGSVEIPSAATAGAALRFLGNVTQTNAAVSALAVWGGDMTFKGGEKVRLDGGITGMRAEKAKGRISFEDVGRVDVGEAFLAGTETEPQVLCVSNSTFCQTGNLTVGNIFSFATVETYDSAFTNTATVSIGTHNGDSREWKYGNRGAFLQHGGDVCLNGLQVGHSSKGGNTGYYGKTGGHLTVTGELDMDTYGFGALYFDGGTADFTLASGSHVACASGGSCVWYQFGGAVNTLRGLRIGSNGSSSDTQTGTSTLFALEGAGTRLGVAADGMGELTLYASGDRNNTVDVVVNDGAELSLSNMQRKGSLKGSQLSWTISVDGGVLHPASTTAKAWGSSDYLPDHVIVGEGGFELKTEAEFTWQTPFVAPTGKVVTAISLPTDAGFLSSQGKYMGPADVRISGSGVGATAVSLYDPATRSITGIRILSTGTGYDDDTTVTIASHAGAATATYACPVTMGDAPTSGKGFLKSGAGMYILGINNTYKGDTAVAGGYLLVSDPTALPTGSGIAVYGGEVGFHQFTPTVPSLKGLGTGLVRNALTVTDTLTLTNSPTAKLTINAKLTLADGAALELVGPVTDIGDQKCVLLEATGGIERQGTFTIPQLTDNYCVRVTSNKITVGPQRGMVMIVR